VTRVGFIGAGGCHGFSPNMYVEELLHMVLIDERHLSGTSFFFQSRNIIIPRTKATGRFLPQAEIFTSGGDFLHQPCKKSWNLVKKCN
jgi:hypothetical protein